MNARPLQVLSLVTTLLVLTAACAGASDGGSRESPDTPTTSMSSMADRPAWLAMQLTDARTGESFTLADFAGKTVYIEPMATWCINCLQQLRTVAAARPNLGEDVVVVGISVETDLPSERLAQYAAENGFDWPFAVASPEFLQALVDTFGRTVANPPATPHFVIWPDGSHSELLTGARSADELVRLLRRDE